PAGGPRLARRRGAAPAPAAGPGPPRDRAGGGRALSGARHAIGIDLGTTNCALASVPLDADEGAAPIAESIPQVVHAGEVGERPLLPSFLYLPGEVELPPGAIALPWDPARAWVVG